MKIRKGFIKYKYRTIRLSDICVASGTNKKDLEEIRSRLEQKNAVFADKRYLDSLFLPIILIGRKTEAEASKPEN